MQTMLTVLASLALAVGGESWPLDWINNERTRRPKEMSGVVSLQSMAPRRLAESKP